MNATHQIKPVKFSEPIIVLNDIFDDAEAWGQPKGGLTIKRAAGFSQLTPALITSEYNMECYTPITEIIEC